MERYVCIHGHFYQPPRENPWLEAVELESSAYPYHDWNERITAECYAPNSASRILDDKGRIVKIVNNYSRISFDFGPTLLSWLKENAGDTYRAIQQADQESQKRFSGHGSALAQAYNHLILPLANRRDKITQILWGIRDFQDRFDRAPEGMWLPETAVDLETLEILAEQGLQFTILAPSQARRVRRIHERDWRDVAGGRIDPSRAYELRLPSGQRISAFFYDGPVSRAVAFEPLLTRGENLANRLVGAFSDSRNGPQIVHIATDGETYGHHKRFGDMALAYALECIEFGLHARLTNYGEYLERHPPCEVVEIFENTSWSCVHGIERWRSDCGCQAGGHQNWNQSWRMPLREALDWLRDSLAPPYEQKGRQFFRNPWAARDDYISVVLDRSPEKLELFLNQRAVRPLNETEQVKALGLLELQRHTLLMYTSCGWFFNEVSGLETVQVIGYAARALQLAREVLGVDLEAQFLDRLGRAKSNLPEHGDGRLIYEKFIRPAMLDLRRVGEHYAVSSAFEIYPATTEVFAYRVEREDFHIAQSGKNRLVAGIIRVTSEMTLSSDSLCFSVLYLGGPNVNCSVSGTLADEAYREFLDQAFTAFKRSDYAEIIRLMDRHFAGSSCSLKSLFRDQQRRITGLMLDSALAEAESAYRQVYESNAPLAHLLSDLGVPLPESLHAAAAFVLNRQLRSAVSADSPDPALVRALLDEMKGWQVELDTAGLAYSLKGTFEKLTDGLRTKPDDQALLQRLETLAGMAATLPFESDFWRTQNFYFSLLKSFYPQALARSEQGDESALAWARHFSSLGEKLGINVEELKNTMKETVAAPNFAATIRKIVERRRIPGATYRLQLNSKFGFRDAKGLIPYLADLGISDLYFSPILQARPGSSHGYDICDHGRINAELGNESDLADLSAELASRGMGLILDIVPNHMGIGDVCNAWWTDVLENGASSIYAPYFDINWEPAKPELKNKVLLPILEDQYGKVLESGKLRLAFEKGSFSLHYNTMKLPVAPRSYMRIIGRALESLALDGDNPSLQEMQSILTALSYLPPRTELSPKKIAERSREKEIIKKRIGALYESSPEIRAAVDAVVQEFNGIVDDSQSYDNLDALLNEQAYRPAFWRVAAEEINYRRFFDVNDLAAIRVEVPEVFQATHAVVFRLLANGQVTGLRIDHADGLWDPSAYLRQLQYAYLREAIGSEPGNETHAQAAEGPLAEWFAGQFAALSSQPSWPIYLVVEKILSEGESIPNSWAADGTTGYDFLNAANGLFVDGNQRDAFTELYHRFIGRRIDFDSLVNSSKKMIMLVSLASEIYALSYHLERITERNRWYRDFTLDTLTFAIREVIASLGIYRTYISGPNAVSRRDQAYIEAAVADAKVRNPRTAEALFNFVHDTLLLQNLRDFPQPERQDLINWVMKFQQITGPVTAKGVEDTAFYIFNRLASLNEVGGYPEQFGTPIAAFHRQNAERARRWPHSMLASSTHDTKRGEDVRARINVLSEMPEEWASALERWSRLNESRKTSVDGKPAPDPNDEYLFYQTLLGAWPRGTSSREPTLSREDLARFRKRMVAYMQKAIKEAKVHTSWVNPNKDYDDAVREFVSSVLSDERQNPFIDDFLRLQKRVACFGEFNSLAQLLLKLTCPGLPDIYQGSELWDLRLVDPDNRGPVDYQLRVALLDELKTRIAQPERGLRDLALRLLESRGDGRVKLYIIHRMLQFRGAHSQLFARGDYLALEAKGKKSRHVCAFTRTLESERILVAVPRLVVGLTDGVERPPTGRDVWQGTWLIQPNDQTGRKYRNLFTDEVLEVREQKSLVGLPLASVFGCFPVGLLERIGDP